MSAPSRGEAAVPVLFVSSHALAGGSERWLASLLDDLPSEWIAGVVSLAAGPAVEQFRAVGGTVEVIEAAGRAGIPRGVLGLRRALRRTRPAVVHANGIKAAAVAVLACAGTGVPVVWMRHDFSGEGLPARMLALASSRVVGVSDAVLETVPAALGSRTSTIHTGIARSVPDRHQARRAVRELAGADTTVIGIVGRLHPAKGQADVIELLPGLMRDHPETVLLLIGAEDPNVPGVEGQLRDRVRGLGMDDHVVFAGWRTDGSELVAGLDILAVPSQPDAQGVGKEGFGLVALEALAAGVPVVGYADGALPEVVGPAGILTPPGSRADLGRALARLVGDPALCERLGARGRARATERFSRRPMVEALTALYRAIAPGTAGGGSSSGSGSGSGSSPS